MAKFSAIKVFIMPTEAAQREKNKVKFGILLTYSYLCSLIVKFRNIKYNEKDL